MITCGWCGKHYSSWKNQCDACGGPMPPPPGMELGPQPPPAPRALPKGFAFRQRFSQNIATILGGVLFVIGTPMTLGVLAQRPWAAAFPALLMVGGFFSLRHGLKSAESVLRAFREGVAVEGKIASVMIDTSQSINEKHPWKLTYHFVADGFENEGVLVSWDSTINNRARGQPLWVLYVEDDPSQNTVYPPFR